MRNNNGSSKKGTSSTSKKDLKISLIAKRLSMLQDDHPTPTPTPPMIVAKSNKGGRVINDDESLEDIACNQLRKIERPTKKVKSSDSAKKEYYKASDNPIKEKIQRMDLSDPLSLAGNKASAMERAKEVQANLSAEFPSFVKLMLKSHVSGGFWLGLPKKFCDEHLPKNDSIVVLVDEAEKKFNTNYLVVKSGLSGGWRGLSIDHDLHQGDVVVFHLIKPTKFKIYIIREQSYDNVDEALGLLPLDSGLGQQISEDHTQKIVQTEADYPVIDHLSQSSSDVDMGPEVLDWIHFSDSDIKFQGIKCFENFNIIVDGLVIDSKFSNKTRKKYFELCHSEGSFLHEHLLKGLNCNLVVGIISETINIADAIKSCKKCFVSDEDLQTWEKTLKGFEILGMTVAFLCSRIDQLQGLYFESKTGYESSKLKEIIIKRAFAGERMKVIENKFTEQLETMKNIELNMEAEMKAHKNKLTTLKETMKEIGSDIKGVRFQVDNGKLVRVETRGRD